MKRLIAYAAISALLIAPAALAQSTSGVSVPTIEDHTALEDRVTDLERRVTELEEAPEPTPDPDPDPTPDPEPDPDPTPDPEPDPDPSPDPAPTDGLWISEAELLARPTSGVEWETVLNASQNNPTPNISTNNSDSDVTALAKAIVAVRTNSDSLKTAAINYIDAHIDTHGGAVPTSLGRNMSSLVIAADLLGHRGSAWVDYVRRIQSVQVDGMTLAERHNVRLSNHGTMSGGSRIAIALYLGDDVEVARAAQVTKAYLGEASDHQGLTFGGDRGWMCDENKMVGINPECSRSIGGAARAVGGVLPAEYQRCGAPSWPPCQTNYIGGGLGGIMMQVELLRRAGYDSTAWGNQALRRAFDRIWFFHQEFGGWWTDSNFAGAGHSMHLPSLAKYWYPSAPWPVIDSGKSGPNMAWTTFTHKR